MHPHLFDHLQYRQEKHHLSWHILKRNVNEEVKNWTKYTIFLTPFMVMSMGFLDCCVVKLL